MVCIEKYPSIPFMRETLDGIKKKFWPIYLKKQHSITINTKEFDRIRQISRCYLD